MNTPDKIDPLNQTDAGILLLNAMSAAAPGDKFEELFIKDYSRPVLVDVVLTVNGVQVPFLDTVNAAWKSIDASLDQMVLEKATELVTAAGLDKLRETLERAEWDITEALRKAQEAQP